MARQLAAEAAALAVTAGTARRVLCLNGLDRLIPVHPCLGGRPAARPREPAGSAGGSAEGNGPGMGR
jgi:hypothetical protein